MAELQDHSEKLSKVLDNQATALAKQIELLKQMTDSFKSEHDILTKLNVIQDNMLASIKEHFGDDRTNFGELQDRVRKVEVKLGYFAGIGAALLAFFSFVSGWIQSHLGLR